MTHPDGDPTARLLRRQALRHEGVYRGVVADNQDPRQMGRIKVRVPEILDDVESGWALPNAPYAGPGIGLFAVPPRDAAVWVAFEGGDPSRPVWLGARWPENGVPAQAPPEDVVLRTPGGLSITLSDQGKKVELADGAGASITLDASGIELKKGGMKVKVSDSSVSVNDGALEVV